MRQHMWPARSKHRPFTSLPVLPFLDKVQQLLVDLFLVSRAQEMDSSFASHHFRIYRVSETFNIFLCLCNAEYDIIGALEGST